MCLLISQPKGLTFSKRDLADFHDYNADGFGVMYGDGKKLHVAKILGDEKDVIATYHLLAAGRKCVLHFRMATHGSKSQENAHPFFVTDEIGMAHNGILDIGNPVHKGKTDTEHLVEFFIRPIALQSPDLLFNPAWCAMLGDLIGKSNRLAFAHADGRIALVNGETGTMHKGAWMSNTYAWSAPGKATSAGYTWTRNGKGKGNAAKGYREMWDEIDAERFHMGDEEDDAAEERDIADTAQGLEALEWLHDFAATFNTGGSIALAESVEQFPSGAATVLSAFYTYTWEEAKAYIRESLASAVDDIEGAIAAQFPDGVEEEGPIYAD